MNPFEGKGYIVSIPVGLFSMPKSARIRVEREVVNFSVRRSGAAGQPSATYLVTAVPMLKH